MNPNNCETCEYKRLKSPDQVEDGHCYMFRDEPQEICMQHTLRKAVCIGGRSRILAVAAMIAVEMSKNADKEQS